ncbi:MAG TPA: glycosyltransferase family 1 protein [Thermoanaerobaculaceae bacterium]|nr:glycosyltransferase family 1 protein [Thermoanaerobaculaceae bacterium]
MRVGIDGKALLPPRAGISRYLEGLLGGLAHAGHPGVELAVVSPERPRRTLPWVLWDLQRATGRGFEVFHFPFYYPSLRPRCPVTVAIHDVLVLEHPEWFPRGLTNTLRLLVPGGARRAAAICTGSASVADAIAERCRVPRERIHLTGYGVDRSRFAPPAPAAAAEARARIGLGRPYLLQLGALEPRRGSDLALAACAETRRAHPDLELAVVGEVRARVAALREPPPWLRLVGRVADETLPALFAGAAAVVAPSRGEGFDLPVLEALSCGAVVVASDIAVHREHFAPAVELFEAGNAGALAAAIAHVLEDSASRRRLSAAGSALAERYSWEDVARRHVGVWRSVEGG